MVVYLHGCSQNNDTDPQVAFGTRWNELAKREGVVVLYPLQAAFDSEHPENAEGNGGSCWNWFLPQNMHRGHGEPAMLTAITKRVAQQNFVDLRRIYVSGASAGADMANILGITYPDVFRASAMFAGCAYFACRDVLGNQARKEFLRHGHRPGPAMVVQGDADMLNNVALGRSLLEQQINMRRLAQTPTSTKHYGSAQAVNPGGGDPCADHTGYPCSAGATGWTSYPYTVKRYADEKGNSVVEWWVIHGLNHDYPNGDTRSSFTDPAGPDVTRAAWNFFVAA
jgi:poly(hydroxyalkanoate) depolymerase family esterase